MRIFLTRYYPYLVFTLLLVMLILEVTSSLYESQTIDEGVHLAAGYSYWQKRDFRMNAEHPPLMKLIAAIPLLPLNLKSPFTYPSWSAPNQWQFAKDFIYDNTISADLILLLARLPVMLLSLLLGFFIFKWAKDLFGIIPAFFSLTLYVFDPNIVAHSRYVTTDLGVTLFFLMAIYYFGQYLKNPSKKNLIISSIIFGLSQVTKFSSVILLPILIILYLLKSWKSRTFNLGKFFQAFLIILLITAGLIWISYGLEIKKPIDDFRVQELYKKQEEILKSGTLAEQPKRLQSIINITDLSKKSGQFIYNLANRVPIPAYSYFKGLIQVVSHNAGGHLAYLLGQYSDYGWWYYFPMAFLVKTPLATQLFLCLVIIILFILFIKRVRINLQQGKKFINSLFLPIRNLPFYVYLLIIPPLIYFLWSLTSHINIGHRHILTIYPFIFIILGYLITFKLKKYLGIYRIIIILFLLFYLSSSFSIYPHYLAYFNEAIGGPGNGPKYLVDSNIDWGQDVKKLKKYMVQNNIEYICLSYFGQAKLEYYNIDYRYLPDNENFQGIEKLDCVVAISVTSLLSQEREYSWLLNYKPKLKIGYSIYVYDFRK